MFSDETPDFPPTVVGREDALPQLQLAFLRGNHYNSVVSLDAPELPAASGGAGAPRGGGAGGVECVVCGKRVEDVEMHIAMTHPEMFQ